MHDPVAGEPRPRTGHHGRGFRSARADRFQPSGLQAAVLVAPIASDLEAVSAVVPSDPPVVQADAPDLEADAPDVQTAVAADLLAASSLASVGVTPELFTAQDQLASEDHFAPYDHVTTRRQPPGARGSSLVFVAVARSITERRQQAHEERSRQPSLGERRQLGHDRPPELRARQLRHRLR